MATVSVSGHTLRYKGEQDVTFSVNGRSYRNRFCVTNLPIKDDGILGMDFLAATGTIIDFGRREMRLYKCPALGSDNMDRRGRVPKPEVNHVTRQRAPSSPRVQYQEICEW